MMTLHLNDDEHHALIELLERELPNLRHEIHHTDDHDYRDFLKGRQRVLERLLESVKAQKTMPASGTGEAEHSAHS